MFSETQKCDDDKNESTDDNNDDDGILLQWETVVFLWSVKWSHLLFHVLI